MSDGEYERIALKMIAIELEELNEKLDTIAKTMLVGLYAEHGVEWVKEAIKKAVRLEGGTE